MANTIYWGQAAVNNTNGFGKSATNNTNDFGEICADSWSPETNLTGTGGTPAWSNTLSTTFDGIDDSVNCGNFSAYDNGDLSVSLWLHKTTMTGGYEYVFASTGSSAVAGFTIFFQNSPYRRIKFIRNTRTSDTSTAYLQIGFTLNTWHHLSFTYNDSTRTLKVYLDGILKNTTIGSASTNSASSSLTMGSTSISSNLFIGNQDEVSIFNTELSQANITDIYNLGTPNDISAMSGLASYWRMGDNDVYPTITDNVGSNNGTMNNMTSANFVTDVPT